MLELSKASTLSRGHHRPFGGREPIKREIDNQPFDSTSRFEFDQEEMIHIVFDALIRPFQ